MTAALGQSCLLAGKVAIVTGAAQGIGLAIAQGLRAHGANVMMADIDRDKVREAALSLGEKGPAVDTAGCDVVSEADQAALVQSCIERFGTVDVLVNNAGVTRDGYLTKLAVSDFDLVIGVSLKGAWIGTRAVAPHFRSQRSGVIINMSSLSGKIGNPGQSTYSSAKAGLIGLTKSAAKELGPSGVRVNAIQPGLVRTAMTLAMKPEIFAAKEAEVPLGRAGTPEEVADAAIFLASPMSSYINGAVLEVTGGRGI